MEHLFFCPSPALGELCAIRVIVPHDYKLLNEQLYQPQIIRCRELIFTELDVIGTPAADRSREFVLIMAIKYYQSKRLQKRLHNLELEAMKPQPVTPATYQECLRYTVSAHLAPQWNTLASGYIQGRDFLTSQQDLAFVDVEINVSNSQICFAVKPKAVKMCPCKLQDLEICPSVIAEFNSSESPTSVIQEHLICRQMKKGQVVRVCKTIPPDSPFKSYKDVRRFWKNSYGYRLPENEDSLLYYQIYFKLIGDRLFTYPSCCVHARDLRPLPRADTAHALRSFTQELRMRVPTACGARLDLRDSPVYTDTRALTGSEALHANEPNIAQEPPPLPSLGPYRRPLSEIPSSMRYTPPSPDEPPPPRPTLIYSMYRPTFTPRMHRPAYPSGTQRPVTSRVTPRPVTLTRPSFTAKTPRPVTPTLRPSGMTLNSSNTRPTLNSSINRPTLTHSRPMTSMIGPRPASRPMGTPQILAMTSRAPPANTPHRPGMAASVTSQRTPNPLSVQPLFMGQIKRSAQGLEEKAAKRVRSKPQVQQVDVAQLAAVGQLGKVNTATLQAWLLNKGVVTKSRDKKQELVSLVNKVLAES